MSDNEPQIVRRRQALRRDKGNGTAVDYFIFHEYEIHSNEIAPGTVQEWHRHERIEETLLLLEGELALQWRVDGESRSELIMAGDVVRVARSMHTLANLSAASARFVVFRLILSGVDNRELFRTDKVSEEIDR
jgi:uncharacterized cupin superfamily protein